MKYVVQMWLIEYSVESLRTGVISEGTLKVSGDDPDDALYVFWHTWKAFYKAVFKLLYITSIRRDIEYQLDA